MADNQQQIQQTAETALNNISGIFIPDAAARLLVQLTDKSAQDMGQVAVLAAKLFQITPSLEQPKPQAVREAAPSIAGSTSNMLGRGIDIALLGSLIALLVNKEAREYLASFLSGLLGIDFNNILTALKLVGIALAGVFAVKVFKQVSDTIATFIRLSKLVGVLFGLTNDQSEATIEEKEKMDKRKQKEKENRKTRNQNRKKRIERLKKLKGLSNFLKKGLAVTGVGLVAGIVVGTIMDYMINQSTEPDEPEDIDEESDDVPAIKEESDEVNISEIGKLIVDNIISTVSFGLLDTGKIKGAWNALTGNKKEQEKNRAAISGMSSSGTTEQDTAFLSATNESKPSPAATSTKTSKEVSEDKSKSTASIAATTAGGAPTGTMAVQSSGGSSPAGAMTTESSSESTSTPLSSSTTESIQPPAENIQATPSTGSLMNASSEQVAGEKKDAAMDQTVVIANVDNRKVIASSAEASPPSQTMTYSVSVGR